MFTFYKIRNFQEKKEKANCLSRFEIVLYFSPKKQQIGGTTLHWTLLAKDTKQLWGGRKASNLSITLNVKVKYFSHQLHTGYTQVTEAHCQCKVKTKKDKIYFLLLRVQESRYNNCLLLEAILI